MCAELTMPMAEHLCVKQNQLDACSDPTMVVACMTPEIPTGACHEGVCLPASCGNNLVDPGEACDDGNQRPDDLCSSDCTSTNVCGNHVTDPIKGEQCDDGNLVSNDGCDDQCKLESARWSGVAFSTPPDRSGAAIAYDAEHRQIVMFGGIDPATSTYLNDTWIYDGNGWMLVTPRDAPSPRAFAGMVYDAAHKRVVLFGGQSESKGQRDTWSWDGHSWRSVGTTTAPDFRWGMAMAYDAGHKNIVLYGGAIAFPPNGSFQNQAYDFTDTWTLDGSTWTLLSTAHSPNGAGISFGRSFATATYDAKRSKVVLFGGISNWYTQFGGFQTALDDNHVWEFDGSDWAELTPASPPGARERAELAYDSVNKRVILFGGFSGGTPLSDTWSWNGTTWTQYTGTAKPEARGAFAFAGDVEHHQVVLFGGTDDTSSRPGAAFWMWNGNGWSAPPPPPSPTGSGRIAALVTFDSLRRRAVALKPNPGTTFESNGTSWKQVGTLAPLVDASIAFDAAHAVTMLVTSDGPSFQTMTWNGIAWTTLAPPTSPPRRLSTSFAPGPGGTMVVFGGISTDTSTLLDDTWIWNGSTWNEAQSSVHPPARSTAMIAYDSVRAKTVLYGGADGNGMQLADTWLWDGSSWTEVTTSPSPSAYQNAGFVWQPDRERILLYGGLQTSAWEWDGSAWSTLVVPGAPFPTQDPMLYPTADGTGMIFYGGYTKNGQSPTSDAALLRWDTTRSTESCVSDSDLDGDMKSGCADEDCWWTCTPTCEPGTSCNTSASPRCGDGTCGAAEACWSCPADCGVCP